MFEWTFFLLLFLAIACLAWGFATKSPVFLLIAGVLLVSHSVLAMSEGVDRPSGILVSCKDVDCNSFDANTTYYQTTTSNDSGFWIFSTIELLAGFVFASYAVGIKVGWWGT